MSNKYAVLSVTTLGSLMAAVDSTIVFLALPKIGGSFDVGIEYLSLVVVMYLVATTAMMIPSVSLARRFGKKKLYLFGFGMFTVSSLLIVISPSILSVVIFRAIEGAGSGILASIGIPILMDAFEKGERGRAVGINSVSWSIGTLVGPVLGGFLVTYDWRYVFLINIPIGIVAIAMGIQRLPSESGKASHKTELSNLIGFLFFIVPFVIGVSFLNEYWLLGALALFPIFLIMQSRKPIIPNLLLHNRSYMLILGSVGLQSLAYFGILYALSIYFQNDLGMSSLVAGIALVSYPIASMIGNPIGGYLLDRTGKGSFIMATGTALQGASIILIAVFINNLEYVFLMLFLSGFGGSLYWATSTTLGIDVGSPELRSSASGTMFTIRNIALIVGLAILPLFVAEVDPSAVVSGLLVLKQNINIVQPVSDYLFFTGFLCILAAVLIVPYHLSMKNRYVQAE